MHVLSSSHFTEFVGCPAGVRATMACGAEGELEPTLVLKAPSLLLKYLLRSATFEIKLERFADGVVTYSVRIPDDVNSPRLVWSQIANRDEVEALESALSGVEVEVFLFNEYTVCVAHAQVLLDSSETSLRGFFADPVAFVAPQAQVLQSNLIDLTSPAEASFEITRQWAPVVSHFVRPDSRPGHVSLFDSDEGRQQEELATWLAGSLGGWRVIQSPTRESSGKELTDILATYQHGWFVFESKTLGILGRERLPNRLDLRHSLEKHLEKAVRQLSGAVRSVRRDAVVLDEVGAPVELKRSEVPHAIVIVPDLTLLSGLSKYGGAYFRGTSKRLDSFFHILDLAELLRVVQGAEMMSGNAASVSTVMALDSLLMQRARVSATASSPHFEILYGGERPV